MVHLFYTIIGERLLSPVFAHYLQQMPSSIRKRIAGFRNWQDAERCLLGHSLLNHALQVLNLDGYSLNDLKYSEFEKPFFDDLISFNISHSGKYVVCAVSTTCKIGVDLEEVKPVSIADFENQFSASQRQAITKDASSASFYKYWTQKESVLKAVGVGMNAELKEINFIEDKITWNDENWYVRQIYFDKDHVCHLACNSSSYEVLMNEIKFNGNAMT